MTTKKEIVALCKEIRLDILEMTPFTKLPDFSYRASNNTLLCKINFSH